MLKRKRMGEEAELISWKPYFFYSTPPNLRIKRASILATPKLSYIILFLHATPQPRILIKLSARFIYKDKVAFASHFRVV